MTAPAFELTTVPPGVALRRLTATAIRRLCVVPEGLSVTDWAAKYRILPETSTSPGPYDPTVVPYARRWQDLLADPSVSTAALCWASQTTKSTVLENAIAYRIVNMPSPMLIARPKIDDAEGWAKERLVPMIHSTPALRVRVELGRGSESTLRYKKFPGGFVFVPSAQSASELASRSAIFVMADEVDRFEVIADEGSALEILKKRLGAADVGIFVVTSTPGLADKTNIWPYLEAGTFEYYHVPCPHCEFEQALKWELLRWERGEPDTARYECAQCKKPIEEFHKHEMLNAGTWIASNPAGRYPSSHLNALYSPFAKSRWGVLADEWDKAQGKRADLQVFINTRLAELWTETADTLSAHALTGRLEVMEQAIVPDGVGALTFGADVQYNRIEVSIWGWGGGLESWLVEHVLLMGDPAVEPTEPGSVWQALDEVLQRNFRHANGRDLQLSAGLVDSGHEATKVYRFTKRRGGRKIFASKGVGGEGIPIIGKPSLNTKERVVMYPIGVDAAKTEFLRSQLPAQAVPGTHVPGFVHLPDWLTTDQCEQFVAEKRFRRLHRGKVVYEWRLKKEGIPNEMLDCRVYARAALELLGSRAIGRLGKTAIELAVPVDPETGEELAAETPAPDEETPPDPSRRRRGGWMRGFR